MTMTAEEVLAKFDESRGLKTDPFPWIIKEIDAAIEVAIGQLSSFVSVYIDRWIEPHQKNLIIKYLERRGFTDISVDERTIRFTCIPQSSLPYEVPREPKDFGVVETLPENSVPGDKACMGLLRYVFAASGHWIVLGRAKEWYEQRLYK